MPLAAIRATRPCGSRLRIRRRRSLTPPPATITRPSGRAWRSTCRRNPGLTIVVDGHDLQLFLAAPRTHRNDVADPLTQQRARERRHERDAILGGVRLVDAHNRHPARVIGAG